MVMNQKTGTGFFMGCGSWGGEAGPGPACRGLGMAFPRPNGGAGGRGVQAVVGVVALMRCAVLYAAKAPRPPRSDAVRSMSVMDCGSCPSGGVAVPAWRWAMASLMVSWRWSMGCPLLVCRCTQTTAYGMALQCLER